MEENSQVKIIKKGPKNYLIYGKGLGSFYAKKNTRLNFGNSGTLARLILGIISTTPGLELKVKGDKSLNKRNMKNLIEFIRENVQKKTGIKLETEIEIIE